MTVFVGVMLGLEDLLIMNVGRLFAALVFQGAGPSERRLELGSELGSQV